MKNTLLLLFAFLLLQTTQGQIIKFSNATISNVDFNISSEKTMIITFEISGGKTSEKFDVTIAVVTEGGNTLETKTISGDLKGVPAGSGKRIIWDMGKDIAYLDENIHVELSAKQINPKVIPYTSKGKAAVWSTFFPGAGSTRLGQNGAHVLKGLIAYTCIGLSVKYNNDAVSSYNDYKTEIDPVKRNNLIDQTQKNINKSNLMIYGAVAVWAIDYLNIMLMKNKTDKRKSKITLAPTIYPVNGKPNFGLVFSFQ